jgi:chemotaxis protein CheD
MEAMRRRTPSHEDARAAINPAKGHSHYLEPGYVYVSRTPSTVRTVVGTCVAVCLWDSKLKYGGMNHFLHPRTSTPEQATPRYGNVATAALVRIMEEAGCKRGDLVAQILGGGAPEGSTDAELTGARNVKAARDVLDRKGIRIAAEDTGGTMGRKIVFDTGTGELAVLKVHKIRDSDWLT